jgi:replicative DNA helicase
LKNPDKIIDVETNEVFAEHFAVEGHRYIFMAMMYLYSKQIKPTPMAIMEVLSSDKSKDEVNKLGGLEYLMILGESELPPDNINIFIDKVKQSYTRKSLVSIADEIRQLVMSDKAEVLNPEELVSFANKKLADLAVNSSTSEEVYKMGTDTDEVLKERAENPCTVPGLEIGWQETDRLTGGAVGGDLIIVCAESKTGKSVTLTNWATKLSVIDKLPILYFDSEMTSRQQEDRILANLSGIPEEEIKNGMYVIDTVNGTSADKIERINKAKLMLKEGAYYHHYLPQFTIEKVVSLARKFQMQHGIVALFFDYIKIPSNQGDFKSAQEYQKLGFFTSGLKDLAGMLNMPVYSACQANREDMGGENPDASKIGGSYRILQLASKLMFLTNKSDERIAKDGFQNGNQQLWIKYQRNGMSDCPPINVFFNKPILRQTEV